MTGDAVNTTCPVSVAKLSRAATLSRSRCQVTRSPVAPLDESRTSHATSLAAVHGGGLPVPSTTKLPSVSAGTDAGVRVTSILVCEGLSADPVDPPASDPPASDGGEMTTAPRDWQSAEQLSPSSVLPSSQTSPGSRWSLPQVSRMQIAVLP